MSSPTLAEKACTKCGETKPLSEFYRQAGTRDGRTTACRICSLAAVRASQARRRKQMGEEAWRKYVAQNVARHRASGRSKDRIQRSAWDEATRRLREMYPDAWEALYREERYKRGLPI